MTKNPENFINTLEKYRKISKSHLLYSVISLSPRIYTDCKSDPGGLKVSGKLLISGSFWKNQRPGRKTSVEPYRLPSQLGGTSHILVDNVGILGVEPYRWPAYSHFRCGSRNLVGWGGMLYLHREKLKNRSSGGAPCGGANKI